MSKTPQFDKALNEILKDLKPQSRVCKTCSFSFEIFKEDIEFYNMLRVPPPKLCPLCRKKRRFGHLMRIPKFFKRPCQAPGHSEEIVTVYPPASPHKIYDFSYWHSDGWEATDYGRGYDFSRPFFVQFKNLFFDVPHVPLDRDPAGVNADYTVGGQYVKNAYYSAMPYHAENVFYSFYVNYGNEIMDCNIMYKSELCYEAVSSTDCSHCFFVVDCLDCLDSYFLYNCKNCSYCFLSSNLRNKSYVFNNVQLTKEEYKKKFKEINLGDREVLEGYQKQFKELMEKSTRRSLWNVNSINSVGDRLHNCKNCFWSFNVVNGENVRYVDNGENLKDSMDLLNCVNSEKLYECLIHIGSSALFTMYPRNSSFLEYCSECYNCHYCFGCVGLQNKKFHIFNRVYSEPEYWEMVDKIKNKMLQDGEYGEFFPLNLNLIPYQISGAQKYFPLEEKEAQSYEISWYEEPESNVPEGAAIRHAPEEIPKDIRDVKDDILNEVLICEVTQRPYRIIKPELDFYQKMGLPIPTKHPWQRMMERSLLEHHNWLYPFSCPRCGKKSFSFYTPEEQSELSVICEECYLKEFV